MAGEAMEAMPEEGVMAEWAAEAAAAVATKRELRDTQSVIVSSIVFFLFHMAVFTFSM